MNDVTPAIVSFSTAAADISTSSPDPERLLEGEPRQTVRNFFSDSTGQFFAGVWESTPGRWRVRYTENEFCHLTRGRIRIEDASGRQWEFSAGDSFVVPAGFTGLWHVLEASSKLYVIYEPSASS